MRQLTAGTSSLLPDSSSYMGGAPADPFSRIAASSLTQKPLAANSAYNAFRNQIAAKAELPDSATGVKDSLGAIQS